MGASIVGDEVGTRDSVTDCEDDEEGTEDGAQIRRPISHA